MKALLTRFKSSRDKAIKKLVPQFRLFLCVALGLLCSASAAHASDVYVAQSSAGGSNGAGCAEARAIGSLNGGDWAPGNAIHLCGTISSTVTAQGSGASGAPVTVVFEAGASITVPACGANGCIDLSGNDYIVIDGSPTASPCGYVNGVDVACNGTIAATANGTGRGNTESLGINAMRASHVEVRNLNIVNMYVHSGAGNDVAPGSYYAIHVDGSYIYIHNCVMHDANGDIVGEAGTNNSEFSNNQMYNSNWNVFLSGPSSNAPNSITQVKIHDNDMHDYANWDTTSDRYHHDGAIIAGNNNLANGISYVSLYNNYIHGSISNCSSNCATAYIFVNDANHVYTFNNVLVAPANQFVYNGLIFYWSPGTLQSNSLIANNTVIGGGMGNGGCVSIEGDASMTFDNNIVSNCRILVDVYTSPSTTFSSMANNVYQDSSLSGVFQVSGNYFSSLAAWLSSLGGVASQAITTSLNLGANLVPLPNSVAVGEGANLSSLRIAALDSDKAGLPRPASGTWDAGAFQSGANVQRPAPPTGLTVSIQ